jgi:hypothetical protein
MMTYEYKHTIGNKTHTSIIDVYSTKEPYELNLSVNGSHFHVLLGSHLGGNFICIPNWEVGCELASYSDAFWNMEKLCKHINPIDAECMAYSIKYLKKQLVIQ